MLGASRGQKIPTWLSAIVLLLGIGAFGAVVWLVMVPNLLREFRQLTAEGPGSLQSVANLFRDLPLFSDASRFSEQLRGYLSGLLDSLPTLLYTTASALAAIVAVVYKSGAEGSRILSAASEPGCEVGSPASPSWPPSSG